jgi:transcriptional regulator
MARANPQWRELDGQKVLVVFQGPQAYISPSFYATKRETGKVVPTWNYAMVQVRGVARVHDGSAWLDAQIAALTSSQERQRAPSWAVSDAPRDFIEAQLRSIVGVEIEIAAIEGKWKVSQNRPEADRRGVAEQLATSARRKPHCEVYSVLRFEPRFGRGLPFGSPFRRPGASLSNRQSIKARSAGCGCRRFE